MTSSSNPKVNPSTFNPQLYDNKCVSEICECGAHRCPPPNPSTAHLPNHQNAFKKEKCNCKCKKATKKKCYCKCKNGRKGQNLYQERHYDPGAIQTVYQLDFQGKFVEQDHLRKTAGNGETGFFKHGSNVPFIGNTEYNTQFVGKIVEKDFGKTKLPQTSEFHQNRPPFDGTTTYNASYQGKLVEREGPIQPRKVAQRPYVPFDGSTEYNSKYQYIAAQERNECESCCDCVSDQCSNCCDCQSVDSLDQLNTNYKQSTTHQNEIRYPPQQQTVIVQGPPLQKTQIQNINTECPIKKLPPAPQRCSPGKTHVKFSVKKNIWR